MSKESRPPILIDGEPFKPHNLLKSYMIPIGMYENRDISPTAKMLWAILRYHAGMESDCRLSDDFLLERLQISTPRRLNQVVRELVELQLISVKRRYKSRDRFISVYEFIWNDSILWQSLRDQFAGSSPNDNGLGNIISREGNLISPDGDEFEEILFPSEEGIFPSEEILFPEKEGIFPPYKDKENPKEENPHEESPKEENAPVAKTTFPPSSEKTTKPLPFKNTDCATNPIPLPPSPLAEVCGAEYFEPQSTTTKTFVDDVPTNSLVDLSQYLAQDTIRQAVECAYRNYSGRKLDSFRSKSGGQNEERLVTLEESEGREPVIAALIAYLESETDFLKRKKWPIYLFISQAQEWLQKGYEMLGDTPTIPATVKRSQVPRIAKKADPVKPKGLSYRDQFQKLKDDWVEKGLPLGVAEPKWVSSNIEACFSNNNFVDKLDLIMEKCVKVIGANPNHNAVKEINLYWLIKFDNWQKILWGDFDGLIAEKPKDDPEKVPDWLKRARQRLRLGTMSQEQFERETGRKE